MIWRGGRFDLVGSTNELLVEVSMIVISYENLWQEILLNKLR